MTEDRSRIATTIPTAIDIAVRQIAAENRTAISVVITACLSFATKNKDNPQLIELLNAEIAELKKKRADVGRTGMASRYGKEGT